MATDTDARKSPDAAQGRIAIDHSTEQCGQRSVHRNDRSQNDDDENASLYSGIIPTGSLFGASSGAHILHEVGTVTGPRSAFANKRQQTSQTLPHNKLPKLQRQASQRDYSDVQFVIPTRKVADHLLNIYWDYVDSAYPWLDRSSIESAYETLWIKDGQLSINERALHCILNLMFATSCVASQAQPPLSRYQSSVEFFDRAQELMSYELMDIYNFEIIQILLLTAVYLQHEKMPQKCLRNISTAIHIAQELGLHMPETIESINDSRERGIARQVWNGCVIMDRIASMTFGFDLKIPQSVAKKGLNYLALNSVEVSSGAGRRSLPSKLNFYVSFCRLHYIIGEVLETFYYFVDSDIDRAASRNIAGERLGSSLSFDKYASLLKIESELCNWAQSLHPFFQMPSDLEDPTPTKHITREANVLRARPFLLQLHHQGAGSTPAFGLYSDDQIMQHVIFQCQVQCTKAARDMIEFIVRNLPEQKQAYLLPSYWYTVSYVYMAVTMLLAAQMSPRIVETFSAAHLKEMLEQARGILKDYEKHTPLASRCRSVIKLIEEKMDIHGLGTEQVLGEPLEEILNREGTIEQREYMEGEEPQNLAWVENYAFDWNDWPMFFAQLDDEPSPTVRFEQDT
ncbi:transcriptional regulator family: Fungal Specific TF [Penicillium atrosanguineum]|uniref:Transcriptional regulator family: Fungal Specific TF n=1 Tax=Penicillium atrosanguineum TaxID=1132637 RepID=A0A9W9GH07_9EURO|nr:uncharacterized protein N7443_007411 [Penicillium atrosanguineum]KAJ5119517.1 transcriptional regulator family: Fungal Specific TF [Penicillium atrosanguineum]KAJ5296518.1 hypothetical protein N7443_007411 [Penicillium atrosanguineum]KAJ5299281.1 transcriptional regulator family: Fungal Specific TF [Penicillium atrosanguineum]